MLQRIFFIIYVAVSLTASAQNYSSAPVHWHSEASDTIKINALLRDATAIDASEPQERVGAIARMFIGTPYAASTLEITPEATVVNLDSMDCTTFVENVLAAAITVGEGRNAWQDFIHNLTSLRYRGGIPDGYASRLHYVSEWILDNEHRGLLRDVTDRIGADASFQVKTLDFMSTNRDKYPALADSAEFQRIKQMEMGYRSHRFPYIKSSALNNPRVARTLRDGDVVALVTRQPGLDVSHLGFIVIEEGTPHLLHASLKEGRVVIDRQPLSEYLKKSRNLLGVRVIRLK